MRSREPRRFLRRLERRVDLAFGVSLPERGGSCTNECVSFKGLLTAATGRMNAETSTGTT